MTPIATDIQSRREDVDLLFERLARINAQRNTLRVAADEPDGHSGLDSMLETLERDLTLAARAAARLHDSTGVSAWQPS
jgi:hypothetical protein